MKAGTHDKEHVHGHQTFPSDLTLRVKALESLLVEKGLVDPTALDALIDSYEHKVGPRNGARVVARAWVDSAYKERLLTDATAAIGELTIPQLIDCDITDSKSVWLSAVALLSSALRGVEGFLFDTQRSGIQCAHCHSVGVARTSVLHDLGDRTLYHERDLLRAESLLAQNARG